MSKELAITNNTSASTGLDVSIDTNIDATPIEITTEEGMTAVLAEENIGKIYKFTGTTGTYVNGDYYIIEIV